MFKTIIDVLLTCYYERISNIQSYIIDRIIFNNRIQ